MQSFERKKNREGRPPVWRSSEGRLREVAPVPRKEGKDHLTGYEPAAAEQRLRPRETGRLAGSYGDVAVGASRKKELTLVISKRRSWQGPAAAGEEKVLKGDSARRINLARGDFRVNSHDKQKSAVAYRESHQKPPQFLLERFKELMGRRGQDALEELVPFLNRQEEREELRQLQSRAEELRAGNGGAARLALRHIEARKQELRQRLTEKESQERRLRLLLQKAQEESRRRAGETESAYSLFAGGGPAAAETPPEDGKPAGGKPKGRKPKGAGPVAEEALPADGEPEEGGPADGEEGEDSDLAARLAAQLLAAALTGGKKKDEKSAEKPGPKSGR